MPTAEQMALVLMEKAISEADQLRHTLQSLNGKAGPVESILIRHAIERAAHLWADLANLHIAMKDSQQ